MKKKTDKMKTAAETIKPIRKYTKQQRTFFLYVPENGFICCSKEVGAMPTYNTKDILSFDSKKMAEYCKEFLMNINFSKNINIVATID